MSSCVVGELLGRACFGPPIDIANVDGFRKSRILSRLPEFLHERPLCEGHVSMLGRYYNQTCANRSAHKKSFTYAKGLTEISFSNFIKNPETGVLLPGAYLCNSYGKNCYSSLVVDTSTVTEEESTTQAVKQFLASDFFLTFTKLVQLCGGTLPNDLTSQEISQVQASLNTALPLIARRIHETFNSSNLPVNHFSSDPSIDEKVSRYERHLKTLQGDLENAAKQSEKQKVLALLPTTIPFREASKTLGVSRQLLRKTRRSRLAQGPFITPAKKLAPRRLPVSTMDIVRKFYLSSGIASPSSSTKDYITVKEGDKKIRISKHFMSCYLPEAYELFKDQHPNIKISLSSFKRLRPQQVIPVNSVNRINVCCCQKHEDVRLLFHAIKKTTYKDILNLFVCDSTKKTCMKRTCEECKEKGDLFRSKIEEILTEEPFKSMNGIRVKQWKTSPRPYISIEDITKEQFISLICDKSEKLLFHSFVVSKQNSKYQNIKRLCSQSKDIGILLVDFAQNFSTCRNNEIQSGFFNNTQITLHPFVFYYYSGTEDPQPHSFCVVSDEMRHVTNTFYTFLGKILQFIKETFPDLRHIHMFSDGCAGQYKNFKNFINLFHFREDFGLDCTWHFFGSGHGKNPCDATAGTVKREARKACLFRNDVIINSSTDFFKWATSHPSAPKKIKFLHVSSEEVAVEVEQRALETRYASFSTVQYTQRIHCVAVSEQRNSLMLYELSSDTEPLVTRIIHEDEQDTIGFSVNSVGSFFAVRYDKNWFPCQVLEVDFEGEEARVDFYKRQRGGHFTKENAQCWVKFVDFLQEIPFPPSSSRKFTLGPDLIAKIDSLLPKIVSPRS